MSWARAPLVKELLPVDPDDWVGGARMFGGSTKAADGSVASALATDPRLVGQRGTRTSRTPGPCGSETRSEPTMRATEAASRGVTATPAAHGGTTTEPGPPPVATTTPP